MLFDIGALGSNSLGVPDFPETLTFGLDGADDAFLRGSRHIEVQGAGLLDQRLVN